MSNRSKPILTTIVLVIVFGTLFNNRNENFPLYVIIGRLVYSYFSEGTKIASKSIRNNAGMIKKVYLPKILYPLSATIHTFIIFLISLIVWVGVDIYCKVIPSLQIFMIIPALLLLFFLTFSVGLFLATLNVFFRDIEYLWNVFLVIIMYMCAIFYYPERLLGSQYSFILKYNPLYQIIDMVRNSFFGTPYNLWGIIYTIIFSFIVFIFSLLFYNCNKDKFILHI